MIRPLAVNKRVSFSTLVATSAIVALTVMTPTHAGKERSRGVITVEVNELCMVYIQSEKSIGNVIYNLGEPDEQKIEYYEDGSQLGTEFVVGSYEDLFGAETPEVVYVKAGKNGSRGVGEPVSLVVPKTAACAPVLTYEIGKPGPAGGVVFYLSDDATAGLEAAREDVFYLSDDATAGLKAARGDVLIGLENSEVVEKFEWGCHRILVGADGTEVGTGATNTQAILDKKCTTFNGAPTAAQAASEYEWPVDGLKGGHLPSKDELNLMYENRVAIGGFATFISDEFFSDSIYWSSSEWVYCNIDDFCATAAWDQFFGFDNTPDLVDNGHKGNVVRVRAVRAF